MTPGLYPGIPDTVYREAEGLSASDAKVLLGKRPPDPSPALAFGTLVHTLVLEPHLADQYLPLDAVKIGVKSDGTPAAVPTMTLAWKRAVAEAEIDGRTVVAQDDWDAALRMRDAVYAHPTARQVIDACPMREISAWAEHDTGVLVKGRLDLLGSGIVADLKTTVDADPAGFGRTCHSFLYHVSAANYVDLANANGEAADSVVFIAVEKSPPYRVAVIQLADRAVRLGRDLMAEACRRWLDLGVIELPGYGDGFHTVDLPPWAYADPTSSYEEL